MKKLYDVYSVSGYDATDNYLIAEGVTEERAKEIAHEPGRFDCEYRPMTLEHGAAYDVWRERISVECDDEYDEEEDLELIAENVTGQEFFSAYMSAAGEFSMPHYYVHVA